MGKTRKHGHIWGRECKIVFGDEYIDTEHMYVCNSNLSMAASSETLALSKWGVISITLTLATLSVSTAIYGNYCHCLIVRAVAVIKLCISIFVVFCFSLFMDKKIKTSEFKASTT